MGLEWATLKSRPALPAGDQNGSGHVTEAEEIFRHEALFYQGLDGFVVGAAPFVTEGIELGEPVLVLAPSDRLDALRDVLNGAAESVTFEDMRHVGKNPGAIISRWREFLLANPGGRVRGIGEPIWAGRTPEELVECQRHEALINVAFTGQPGTVLCPYDTQALAPDVLEEAERSHPILVEAGVYAESSNYLGIPAIARPFDMPLAPPQVKADVVEFDGGSLSAVRRRLSERGSAFGLSEERIGALQLAVTELAANSVRHGGGGGTLTVWTHADVLYCEVSDRGRIIDPLAGRQLPATAEAGGRGLWLVNQLCDLVQLRSSEVGSVVRVHMRRD